MTETTQKDRDKARRVLSDEGFNQKLIQPTSWLISLLNDADRLAKIERGVRLKSELEAEGIEVPEGTIVWERDPTYTTTRKRLPSGCAKHCLWITGLGSFAHAPDLCPDTTGELMLAIIDDDEQVRPLPDCYSCKGTGRIQGFGHHGERCPCLDRDTNEE